MRRAIAGLMAVMTVMLAVDAQAIGTGQLDRTSGWFPAGSNLVVIATPGTNSVFDTWLGDTNGADIVGSQITLTVNSPMSITGRFSHIQWDIVAGVGTGLGSISSPGTNWVPQSSNKLFTITADTNAGYHIANLVIDGQTNAAAGSYMFSNVTNAHTITANFALNEYTITYLAGANGSITGSATQTVLHGSSGAAVSAVADAGHHFVNWSDGPTTALRSETGVTNDITVTANFDINQYVVTIDSGHGMANPSGVVTANWNTVVNVGITNSPVVLGGTTQYQAIAWSETQGASGSGANASFTVSNDTTVAWQWQTNYWINFGITGN